jgi:hypothetical protein
MIHPESSGGKTIAILILAEVESSQPEVGMSKIEKTNLRRLASLSALGAGALGVTAGAADASTIVYSGIVDEKIGFEPGYASKATMALPGGAAGVIAVWAEFFPNASSSYAYFAHNASVGSRAGAHGTNFRVKANGFGEPTALPFSARFGRPPASRSVAYGNLAHSDCTTSGRFPHCHTDNGTFFNSTDRYLLFKFTGGNLLYPIYGWAQLSFSFPGGDQIGYPNGPDVTLIDWAYNLSGGQIPAGDTGTPEPSTLALSGLAALALGAKGLRSWRAARKAA